MKAMKRATDPLLGKFFHSRGPEPLREIQWQGEFIARLDAERYLVQLFDWIAGSESKQVVVHTSEMSGWDIYGSDEEMRRAYGRYQKRYQDA